jgi:hypothetical protein
VSDMWCPSNQSSIFYFRLKFIVRADLARVKSRRATCYDQRGPETAWACGPPTSSRVAAQHDVLVDA